MPAALLERLINLNRTRSKRGNIDWPTLLTRSVQDSEASGLLRQIPSAERRALLAEVGRTVYNCNIGNYASELHYNTEFVISSGQLPDLREQLGEHAACVFAALSDSIDFSTRAGALAHLSESNVEISGLENLHSALGNRGLVLLNVCQSHFGYAASLLETVGHISLVWKVAQQEGDTQIPQIFLDWTEDIDLVPATPHGALRMLRILRKGGIVGLYNDFIYPDARATRGLLFGRYVPISRTLLQIILNSGAAVIPMAIARALPLEGRNVHLHLFTPLQFHRVNVNEVTVAIQLSLASECLIRRYPIQWRHWNTLRMRWDAARDIT